MDILAGPQKLALVLCSKDTYIHISVRPVLWVCLQCLLETLYSAIFPPIYIPVWFPTMYIIELHDIWRGNQMLPLILLLFSKNSVADFAEKYTYIWLVCFLKHTELRFRFYPVMDKRIKNKLTSWYKHKGNADIVVFC